jgi:hypothetical protein
MRARYLGQRDSTQRRRSSRRRLWACHESLSAANILAEAGRACSTVEPRWPLTLLSTPRQGGSSRREIEVASAAHGPRAPRVPFVPSHETLCCNARRSAWSWDLSLSQEGMLSADSGHCSVAGEVGCATVLFPLALRSRLGVGRRKRTRWLRGRRSRCSWHVAPGVGLGIHRLGIAPQDGFSVARAGRTRCDYSGAPLPLCGPSSSLLGWPRSPSL